MLGQLSPASIAACSTASTRRSGEPPQRSSSSGPNSTTTFSTRRLGNDDGSAASGCLSDRLGLVVAVVRREAHWQPFAARPPVGALAEPSMGDVAERAVGAPDPGSQKVRQLAERRAVGVVYTYQPLDGR